MRIDPDDRADARVAALHGYIDDAGVYPPAELPLPEALDAHGRSRASPYGWIVRRFVCPLPQLPALAGQLTDADGPLRLALTSTAAAAGEPFAEAFAAELRAAAEVLGEHPEQLAAEVVEVRLPPGEPAEQVATAVRTFEDSPLPDDLRLFVEPADCTDAVLVREVAAAVATNPGVRHHPSGVKLRCGGPRPELIPGPEAVAAWLVGATRRGLTAKATAGLHHPRPRWNPDVSAVEHGFLNLLAAAALAAEGAREDTVAAAVAADGPEAIALDAAALSWGEQRWEAEALATVRRAVLTGQGSCSLAEPVEDLVALGVLPAAEEAHG